MAEQTLAGVLTFKADATQLSGGLAKVVREIEKVEDAAVDAGNSVGAGMTKAAGETTAASAKMDRATRSLMVQLQRASDQAGRTKAEYYELRAAQLGVADRAAPMIARLKESEKAVDNFGISAGQTAAAMRMVPAQMTDIVTSIASGMPVWLVAIQQGGQLKDSFGGLGPMFRQLATVFTPVRIGLGAVAAGVGALVAAYAQGSRETDAYTRALVLSGNAAGATVGQLAGMARGIAAVTGTQGAAAAALAAMAATGRVAADDLQEFSRVAVDVQRVIGSAVEDTVSDFAALGKEPVEASLRLTEQHNYLTVAVYEQIRALQEQGREAEAASRAQSAYADALDRRQRDIEQSLGTLERAWNGLKSAASGAWDAMLNIGRQSTLQDRLDEARERVVAAETRLGSLHAGRSAQAARDNVVMLEAMVRAEGAAARVQADHVRIQREGLEATQQIAKAVEAGATKQARMNRELREFDALLERQRKAGGFTSEADAERARAAIRDKYKPDKETAHRETQAQRLMATLLKTEAALDEQLATEEKLGAAAKARVDFETQIALIKARGPKDADDRSMLAQESALRAQLATNEAKEKEFALQEAIREARERDNERQLAFLERSALMHEQIAQSQENQREQYRRDLAGLGLGQGARAELSGREAIIRDSQRTERRFANEWKDLLGSDEYEREAARIRASLQQSLRDHADYWQGIRDAQGDATLGASRAINNFMESAADVAGQTEDAMTRAFSGAEDAIVSLVRTGKADIRSLADSILADIARIQIRQALAGAIGGARAGGSGGGFLGAIGGFLGAMLPSGAAPITASVPVPAGGGIGPRAGGIPAGWDLFPREHGGPVSMGKSYLVGEKRPEVFTPAASGTITPHAGGTVINSTVNAAPGVNVAQLQAVLDARDAQLSAHIADSMRRGRWPAAAK